MIWMVKSTGRMLPVNAGAAAAGENETCLEAKGKLEVPKTYLNTSHGLEGW